MTLNVQNVYRWLTRTTAVACGSFSQRCQWLSPVTQSKLTKAHFKAQELVLASVAAFVKTPALPPNLIIHWIGVGESGPLIISDKVKAVSLVETQNLKR